MLVIWLKKSCLFFGKYYKKMFLTTLINTGRDKLLLLTWYRNGKKKKQQWMKLHLKALKSFRRIQKPLPFTNVH